ncbi:hypothetical protein Lal_00007810 [Lupinus albus]|nr:hypothetical protein Lal_00007810 [Lupinus albus]
MAAYSTSSSCFCYGAYSVPWKDLPCFCFKLSILPSYRNVPHTHVSVPSVTILHHTVNAIFSVFPVDNE